jgi:hypothetical protein
VVPVTITPSGPAGSVVSGTLYIDALVGGLLPVGQASGVLPTGQISASRWLRCRTSTPSADPTSRHLLDAECISHSDPRVQCRQL